MFTCCADREAEVGDWFTIQIPDDANRTGLSIWMHLERNIDILAGLKCVGGL